MTDRAIINVVAHRVDPGVLDLDLFPFKATKDVRREEQERSSKWAL